MVEKKGLKVEEEVKRFTLDKEGLNRLAKTKDGLTLLQALYRESGLASYIGATLDKEGTVDPYKLAFYEGKRLPYATIRRFLSDENLIKVERG